MNLRRINIAIPVLRERWKKKFYIDTIKALKPTKLRYEDLNLQFSLNIVPITEGFKLSDKGTKTFFRIIGSIRESKQLAIESVATRRVFGFDRWEVSTRLHPEDHKIEPIPTEIIYQS